MTAKATIADKAIKLLAQKREGVRYSVLVQKLSASLPEMSVNTIRGTLVRLVESHREQVYKPVQGLFRHTMYRPVEESAVSADPVVAASPKERDFYAAFAEYLTGDLEECTKCIPLGGCGFKDKWGTPDVIGIRRARESDLIKYPTEIISAEIKTDANNLITAFGQACSYRLFSHRSYLVVPRSAPTEDLARLESLSIACGLGLILFDNTNSVQPSFAIRVRAMRTEPDMFYVNRNLKLIEQRIFD